MNPRMQMVVPFTKMVKRLVIANVVIWVGAILILQGFVLQGDFVYQYFGLVPARVITDFWVWQIFTYIFLHSGASHILFNMLSLWWFGSELESRWGSRFFLSYYFVCGVGAGLIYLIGTVIYYLVTGKVIDMAAPLVGASGAVFGLLLAYGLLFGERMIYFMMLFPMKAKYFTMIIGAVELVTMLDSGPGSRVANLAHLGGLAVGFAYLSAVARVRARRSTTGGAAKRGRRLKLVVNNERKTSDRDLDHDPKNGPKYWN
ncbi:MAG: rhomboid family intramembrane serine protease [Calothrix sp. SM1_5_4]|nr:rhomboid family intramembrane serine protease [Calothrix sp. SM1_5_4]